MDLWRAEGGAMWGGKTWDGGGWRGWGGGGPQPGHLIQLADDVERAELGLLRAKGGKMQRREGEGGGGGGGGRCITFQA